MGNKVASSIIIQKSLVCSSCFTSPLQEVTEQCRGSFHAERTSDPSDLRQDDETLKADG